MNTVITPRYTEIRSDSDDVRLGAYKDGHAYLTVGEISLTFKKEDFKLLHDMFVKYFSPEMDEYRK